MKIQVTQEDINQGSRRVQPVARAISRELGKVVGVSNLFLMVFENGRLTRYQLPFLAKDFIQRFDQGKDVIPFEFEFNLGVACESK